VARERPAASNDQQVDVPLSIPPRRPHREGLTRAEAHALTRCAPLTPGGDPAAMADASRSWIQRADRLGVGDLRRRVASFAALAGMGDDELAEMQVAVSEALTNVVLHAYGAAAEVGDVRIDAEIRVHELVVCVRDYGPGLQAHQNSAGLGLGLSIIARLSKSYDTRRCDDGGTELTMNFALRGQEPPAMRRPAST